MDILQIGADILSEKLGLSVDSSTIQSALSGLLGDGNGGLDLSGLMSNMMSSGGLASVASSWLGDGENSPIDADSIMSLLGESKISDFASQLGIDGGQAVSGLSEALPQMMDKASSGGNLLDAVGGAEGLLGAAKSFFS